MLLNADVDFLIFSASSSQARFPLTMAQESVLLTLFRGWQGRGVPAARLEVPAMDQLTRGIRDLSWVPKQGKSILGPWE